MATTNPASQTRPLSVVTGASSGIGYQIARKLAEVGYDVVAVSSNREKLTEAAETIHSEFGDVQIEIVQADLRTPDGVKKLYESVQSLGRPVDILVANAGVGAAGEFADETSLEDEIGLINLNVTSQVHLMKLMAHDMVNRGWGDILITSSIAGILPAPHMAVYAASKAFLRSFGEAIRQELKDRNVNVTVLMPGPTDTDFFDRADMNDRKVAQSKKQDAEEVAEAALRALSESSDHVIPGLKNKVQAGIAKMMSDPARAKMHAKMTEKRQ